MTLSATPKTLVILDFGSQYTQLLARRIRELSVYCEIHPWTLTQAQLIACNPIGVILSGGPSSVTDPNAPTLPAWLFELSLPILGICYGMQAMAVSLGGQVAADPHREYGLASMQVASATCLFNALDTPVNVWMSHGDRVTTLPEHFHPIGKTDNAPIAAMAHHTKPWFGVQFHPEVTHTDQGQALLARFLFDYCGATKNWTVAHKIDQFIADIRDKVGSSGVLLGLSGGVDSSVVAALLHQAIGAQLQGLFVDTGLLRKGEVDEVKRLFSDHLGINVIYVDAKALFLEALRGVTCPEEKRRKIGHAFIEVFQAHAKPIASIKFLAQGTIYPDVIESASANLGQTAQVIKSHHNVGGLPASLSLTLLEPLRTLFKDEVRQLGLALGLPHALIYRHPFPGPGLGIRVLGEVTEAALRVVRQADAIFIQALRQADLYDQVSQAFAVFLPVKTVGVMGDGRVYEPVICLRAVETQDFMTAASSRLSWDFLESVARRILNEVKGVSRVLYDISGKPPATIEWE